MNNVSISAGGIVSAILFAFIETNCSQK